MMKRSFAAAALATAVAWFAFPQAQGQGQTSEEICDDIPGTRGDFQFCRDADARPDSRGFIDGKETYNIPGEVRSDVGDIRTVPHCHAPFNKTAKDTYEIHPQANQFIYCEREPN